MKTRTCKQAAAGTTLVEVLVASAVSSVIFASIVGGAVVARRGMEAADFHVTAQTEQLRIFDYIGRDLRAASAVAVVNGGARLDLGVPSNAPGSLAMHLELPSAGTLHTNAGSVSQAVSYYCEGDRLIRESAGVQTELARTVLDFQVTRAGALMEVSATFSPRFSHSRSTAGVQASRMSAKVFLRNAPAN